MRALMPQHKLQQVTSIPDLGYAHETSQPPPKKIKWSVLSIYIRPQKICGHIMLWQCRRLVSVTKQQ